MWRVIAASLGAWMDMALSELMAGEDQLNQLNVFPVPDADTGYNMVATVREAVLALRQHPWNSFEGAWKHLADGALNGARGNSGMILSQLLRGFAQAAEGRLGFEPEELIEAFRQAAHRARQQVAEPVEGTILTVADAMGAIAVSGDVVAVLATAVEAGERALRNSAGKFSADTDKDLVDAGGLGYVMMVRGWLKAARGEEAKGPFAGLEVEAVEADEIIADIPFYYDVEALLYRLRRTDAEEFLRTKLQHLGNSIVVASTSSAVKVHVHTNQPVALMALFMDVGDVRQMEWLDMRYQVERRTTPVTKLQIAAPSHIHPMFSDSYTVMDLDSSRDGPDRLVIGSAESYQRALTVDSLALAGEIVQAYVPGDDWEANRARMVAAVNRRTVIQVFRHNQKYQLNDRVFSDRTTLSRAIGEMVDGLGSITLYLSQNASSEEAKFWKEVLNAQLVPTPHPNPWMEVVWMPSD